MDKDSVLEGEKLRVFLPGGWFFDGILISADEEDIALESPEGLFLIARKQIIALLVMADSGQIDELEDEHIESFPVEEDIGYVINQNIRLGSDLQEVERNGIGVGNQYGSLIPADLLEGDEPDEVELSISLSNLMRPDIGRGNNDSSQKD